MWIQHKTFLSWKTLPMHFAMYRIKCWFCQLQCLGCQLESCKCMGLIAIADLCIAFNLQSLHRYQSFISLAQTHLDEVSWSIPKDWIKPKLENACHYFEQFNNFRTFTFCWPWISRKITWLKVILSKTIISYRFWVISCYQFDFSTHPENPFWHGSILHFFIVAWRMDAAIKPSIFCLVTHSLANAAESGQRYRPLLAKSAFHQVYVYFGWGGEIDKKKNEFTRFKPNVLTIHTQDFF